MDESMSGYFYVSPTKNMQRNKKRFAILIGNFMIEFGLLEHTLTHELVLLMDTTSTLGFNSLNYLCIKHQKYADKVNLFNEYVNMLIKNSECPRIKNKKRLGLLNENLKYLGTLRNKIAHVNWYTLDEENYVHTEIDIPKNHQQEMFLKKMHLSTQVLKDGINTIHNIIPKLSGFHDDIYDDYWGDWKKYKTKQKSKPLRNQKLDLSDEFPDDVPEILF